MCMRLELITDMGDVRMRPAAGQPRMQISGDTLLAAPQRNADKGVIRRYLEVNAYDFTINEPQDTIKIHVHN